MSSEEPKTSDQIIFYTRAPTIKALAFLEARTDESIIVYFMCFPFYVFLSKLLEMAEAVSDGISVPWFHKSANRRDVEVRLPDLFILFLSEEPEVNTHYPRVRDESETWITKSVVSYRHTKYPGVKKVT